jgi:hypothetical protein
MILAASVKEDPDNINLRFLQRGYDHMMMGADNSHDGSLADVTMTIPPMYSST